MFICAQDVASCKIVLKLNINKKYTIRLFSAILGNAGAVSKEELAKDFGKLLIDDEEIELGFKLIRDTFIFTAKRFILVDKQRNNGEQNRIYVGCL